jgi:hypothetical protein
MNNNAKRILRVALVACAATAVTPFGFASGASKNKKSSNKGRPTTTSKPATPVRFVWMCDLMTRIDMEVIPGHSVTSLTNPYQRTGDPSDWRTEDLKAATLSGIGACQAFYASARPSTNSITISQVFKKTDTYFSLAPDWNKSFKWVKTQVVGVSGETWFRKNGRYRASNNIEMAPGCQVGVKSPRGVFLVQWQDFESQQTDASQVTCAVPEEAMRRTLAALEAGGYKYLN